MQRRDTNRPPFGIELRFERAEIDQMCVDELEKAKTFPATPGPINIESFIGKHLCKNYWYEDLPEGVLGFTAFEANGSIHPDTAYPTQGRPQSGVGPVVGPAHSERKLKSMKATTEEVKTLAMALAGVKPKFEQHMQFIRDQGKAKNLNLRLRWDALWLCRRHSPEIDPLLDRLYKRGLNDRHIDTVLKAALRFIGADEYAT